MPCEFNASEETKIFIRALVQSAHAAQIRKGRGADSVGRATRVFINTCAAFVAFFDWRRAESRK